MCLLAGFALIDQYPILSCLFSDKSNILVLQYVPGGKDLETVTAEDWTLIRRWLRSQVNPPYGQTGHVPPVSPYEERRVIRKAQKVLHEMYDEEDMMYVYASPALSQRKVMSLVRQEAISSFKTSEKSRNRRLVEKAMDHTPSSPKRIQQLRPLGVVATVTCTKCHGKFDVPMMVEAGPNLVESPAVDKLPGGGRKRRGSLT
jgi:hypothetical protein